MKKVLKCIGFILGIYIVYILLQDVIENRKILYTYFMESNKVFILLSIAVFTIAFFVNGYTWAFIIRKIKSSTNLLELLNVQFSTAFARFIPGGIWGSVGKIVVCSNIGIEKKIVGYTVFLEYMISVFTSVLFGIFFIPLLTGFSIPYIVLIIIFVLSPIIFSVFYNQIVSFILKLIKKDIDKISLEIKTMFSAISLYILSWALNGIALLLLVNAFYEISIVEAMYLIASYPVSWVIGFVSPTPNGIGVREWCISFLLGATTISSISVIVGVLARVCSTIGECIVYILIKLAKWRKNVY